MTWSSRSWLIHETSHALVEKSFSPLAYFWARHIELLADFFIIKAFGSHKNYLGSKDLIMR